MKYARRPPNTLVSPAKRPLLKRRAVAKLGRRLSGGKAVGHARRDVYLPKLDCH